MIMLLKQHYFNLAQELPIATWQKMAKSEKNTPLPLRFTHGLFDAGVLHN